MQRLPKLQSVKLDGCQVTSAVLKAIGQWCISLRELSLSKCAGVADDGLSFLVSRHRELRKLDIACCREITNISIESIATSCTSLTSLRMESCTLVSEKAFISIGQNCHFLEELDFTDNEVDNEGFFSLPPNTAFYILRHIHRNCYLYYLLCRFEVHIKMFQTCCSKNRNLLEHNR